MGCLRWNFILDFSQAQNIWLLFSVVGRYSKWKKSLKSQNGTENQAMESICRQAIKMQLESMEKFHCNDFKLIFFLIT